MLLVSAHKMNHFLIECDEKWKWNLYDSHERSPQWLDKDKTQKYKPNSNVPEKKLRRHVLCSGIGVIYYGFIKIGSSIMAKAYYISLEQRMQHRIKKIQQKLL